MALRDLTAQAQAADALAAEWQATAEAYRAEANVAKDRVAELERKLNLAVAASGHKAELLNAANARIAELERETARQTHQRESLELELDGKHSTLVETADKLRAAETSLAAADALLAEWRDQALDSGWLRFTDLIRQTGSHLAAQVKPPEATADWFEVQVEALQRDLSAANARIAELEAINRGLGLEVTAARARIAELEAMAKGDREALHRVLDDRDAANARAEAAEKSEREWKHWRATAVKACDKAEAEVDSLTNRLRLRRDERDLYEWRLAAATALLRQVHAEQAPTVSLLCAISDLLSSTPAPSERAAAERAVLDACAVLGEASLRLVTGRMRGVAKAILTLRAVTK